MNQTIKNAFAIAVVFFTAKSHAQSPTFNKEVAPIIHTKCTPCHRPNESAPFNLITFEDVSRRATFIKTVVESGYMPPWKADNKYAHYSNDRSLTAGEKKTLIDWVKAGAPRGTGKPPMVETVETLRKQTAYHRAPDLSITTPTAYNLKGDNYDRFVMYRIPFELDEAANVEAIEFVTPNKKLVHHVNYAVHAVPEGVDIKSGPNVIDLAVDDPQLVDEWKPLKKTIEYYGGWIPGASYESYPEGMGWILPKRGVIILTLHYAASPNDESCTAGLNLFFTTKKVERQVKVISFGSGGIGEEQISPPFKLLPNQVRTFSLTLSNPGEDFSVLYVWPHMHLLGRQYTAYAISPKGDTIKLVNVPDWDFRWQEIYRFKKLIPMPRGSRLMIKATYDNTANNPFNPFSPPRMIYSTGNMETTNEMLTLLMVFLPYKPGDENLEIVAPGKK
ncbi:MAG: cytochrome c [Bacteroidetes bacterium]|nr:MAG: cytochrome c [Bacteroidota bacterium]